jgi:hypothetical protein
MEFLVLLSDYKRLNNSLLMDLVYSKTYELSTKLV